MNDRSNGHFLSDWEIQKLQTANICYDSSLIRDVDHDSHNFT